MNQRPASLPSKICANDLALTDYAILSDSVGYSAGHGLMFVDEKEIGEVPCLAICKDKDSDGFTLYYCDRNWNPIGVASYASVADAKKRAERIYPGSFACRIEAQPQ